MHGFLWAEYPASYHYYGRGIPVPTPNPQLVKFVKKTKTAKTPSSAAPTDGQLASPNGFIDDEDHDAPCVGEANEESLNANAIPHGTPNWKKRPAWVNDTLSYVDDAVIPNYRAYAKYYSLCDAFFSSLTGPSLPNHLYVISAQSASIVNNAHLHKYFGIYSFPSVIELLDKRVLAGGTIANRVLQRNRSGIRYQALRNMLPNPVSPLMTISERLRIS
jgi:phospholipase C